MSIKKSKTGTFKVDIRDERDNRIRKTFTKKIDAEAFVAKIKNKKYEEKLIGANLKPKRYSIFQCLDEFAATKQYLKPNSRKKYDGVIKQISDFFTAINITYIDEFTMDHAALFVQTLTQPRSVRRGDVSLEMVASPQTINFYIATMKAFFKYEILKDHLLKDPTRALSSVKTQKAKPDFYTLQEIDLLFAQEMNPCYRNFFLGLFYTGMRFGEAANLEWCDIDFERNLIYVRDKYEHSLKSESSERVVPMPKELRRLLDSLVNSNSSRYVFPNGRGEIMKERRALDKLKIYAKRAGINGRAYLHKFRKTYATYLVQHGVPLESIKELLGHASILETEKSYANNDASRLHAQVEKLDSLLSK